MGAHLALAIDTYVRTGLKWTVTGGTAATVAAVACDVPIPGNTGYDTIHSIRYPGTEAWYSSTLYRYRDRIVVPEYSSTGTRVQCLRGGGLESPPAGGSCRVESRSSQLAPQRWQCTRVHRTRPRRTHRLHLLRGP